MNLFRTKYTDYKLDKQYLRVCACHKLLKQGKITKDRAIELLKERKATKAEALVELWLKRFKEPYFNG